MNDDKLTAMKQLRNALCETITAIEAGREAEIEFRQKASDEYLWLRFVFAGEYRVVCKLREVWATFRRDGKPYMLHATREDAALRASSYAGGLEIVRLVEPTDDQP
jgi:hypothetical protein